MAEIGGTAVAPTTNAGPSTQKLPQPPQQKNQFKLPSVQQQQQRPRQKPYAPPTSNTNSNNQYYGSQSYQLPPPPMWPLPENFESGMNNEYMYGFFPPPPPPPN